MAIQNARSNTTGHAPTSLIDGQIAVNQVDGTLFTKITGGGIRSTFLVIASTAEALANAASRLASMAVLWAMQAPVSVAYAATVTLDFSAGLNFSIAPLTGNLTLANPTNPKAGQSGFIKIPQDATGSRTLAVGSAWKFSGGPPTASTAANTVDGISYYVEDASTPIIRAAYLKAFA